MLRYAVPMLSFGFRDLTQARWDCIDTDEPFLHRRPSRPRVARPSWIARKKQPMEKMQTSVLPYSPSFLEPPYLLPNLS